MNISVLETTDISYLEKILLNDDNELQILPYSQLKDIPQNDISQFCVKHGFYNIPTLELMYFLKSEIDGREASTIEIGAGNGVMSKYLNIIATDSMQQNSPIIKAMYLLAGQTPVSYGKNVYEYDAVDAIKIFHPDIVLGAWVTHKYNPLEHWREGNEDGIDENYVINNVQKYIFIGNEGTHNLKPTLNIPHKTIKKEWLLSRSINKDKNVIWIWTK